MPMDQLRAMRLFIGVVDAGSFAGAARAFDLAPPIVTRAIGELETHLGSRLLNRTTRSLTLTDVGAEYLERIRPLVDELDDADALATAATGQVRGRLRLTGTAGFLAGSLTPLLRDFQRQHPLIQVQLNVSPPLREPDEKADVTFLVEGAMPLDGDFVARPLARTEVVLCASPAYLDARGRPGGPEDLDRHELLAPDVPFIKRHWQLRQGQQVVTLAPPPARIVSASPEMLVGAARHGLGMTGALSLDVAGDLRSGALERVLPAWHIAHYQVYAAMPSRRHVPLRVRTFVDHLVASYAALEAGTGGDPSGRLTPSDGANRV